MKKKGWLSSLWERLTGQDFETVAALTLPVQWQGSSKKDTLIYIFQENATGQKRISTHSSTSKLKPKRQRLYRKQCKPWLRDSKELIELDATKFNPMVYSKLGYQHLGTINLVGDIDDENSHVQYHLFSNADGERRVTKQSVPEYIEAPEYREICLNWINKQVEAEDIKGFSKGDTIKLGSKLSDTPSDSGSGFEYDNWIEYEEPKREIPVISRTRNITRVDFTQPKPPKK